MKGFDYLNKAIINPAEFERYAEEARAFAKKSVFPVMAEYNTVNANSLDEFKGTYSGRGTLKVQVTSGQGTLPVPLANVEVFTVYNGERLLIFSDRTDQSGIVESIILPALPTELSENYETAENSGTEYLVNVKHASFEEKIDVPIKIYNGIESILPVNLIPVLR